MATGGGSLSIGSEPFYDFSCSNCAKDNKHTEGESYCVECNETFCTSCLVFHNKIAIMRQHTLLDQIKMAARRPQQDLVHLPTSMCTVHEGLVINMYCGQDDIVCCTVCIAEDHRTCEGVSYIPKKVRNIKKSQEFQDVNAAIDTIREDIRMVKKGKQLDLERNAEQHLHTQASIKEFRDQINQHLDKLEATTKDELERKFKIHEDQINDTLATLEDQLSKLEESALKLKNGQNESQVFVDMKEAKIKEKSNRKLIDDVEKSVGNPAMKFVPNNEIFQMLEIKDFGTLKDQNTIASVSHHGDFDVKTLNDKYQCKITGACLMLDGNIAITDLENEKLKLLDSSYMVIKEQELPDRPKDLCRTSPTEVAIALYNNKIVQFAEVTEKISLKTSFAVGDACRGIAYNKGLLYVLCGGWADECLGQVQVYDKVGQLQKVFMTEKNDLFLMPLDIVVSECRKKLYVAQRNNGIITINLDGIKKSEFTIPDVEGYNGICVVNKEELIVCGSESNSVILSDNKGKQRAVLLEKKDGITLPMSVLYDRLNSRLLVSLYGSNHIKVYNTL